MKNPKEIKIKKPMGRPKKIKELAPPDIQPEVSVSLFEELSSDSIAMETIITDTSAEAFAIKNTKKIANKSNIGLEVTDNVVKLDDIDWFTEVDYNSKGKIAANYPAWYYDIPLDELKEEN